MGEPAKITVIATRALVLYVLAQVHITYYTECTIIDGEYSKGKSYLTLEFVSISNLFSTPFPYLLPHSFMYVSSKGDIEDVLDEDRLVRVVRNCHKRCIEKLSPGDQWQVLSQDP